MNGLYQLLIPIIDDYGRWIIIGLLIVGSLACLVFA
jgi:hypothetical protein